MAASTKAALKAGHNFLSSELTYFSDSAGGMYPFANFTVVVRDSQNLTSANCTYLFSFKCPPGLVNNVFSEIGAICAECPEGAVCSSDGSQLPYPKYGWWRSDDNTTFLPCFPMHACPGSPFIPCSDGYTGTRCGRCSPGYYRFNDGCRQCGEQGAAIQLVIICGITILVAAAFILILRISRQKRGATFGLVSILVNYIQTILLLRQMRLNWPEPLLHMFSWLSFINFNVELASPECLVTEQAFDFSFKMKLSLSIPLVALVIASLIPIGTHVMNLVKPQRKKIIEQDPEDRALLRIFKAYMSFLNLLFVHVATSSLSLFDCTKEADNISYLDSDSSLRCYEPWYYQDLPYGIAGLCCYVLGIPLMSVIVSYAALRARKNRATTYSILNKFQLFCEKLMSSNHEFKPDYRFISVVQLFQKLFLVVVNIFFTRYVGLQIILTLFVLFSSVQIVTKYSPYEFPILNKFDILSNIASMVVLGLGLTFHFDKLSNSLHGLAIIVLIIMVNCGFIIWVVGAIIRESFINLELMARFAKYRKSSAGNFKYSIDGTVRKSTVGRTNLDVAKSARTSMI
ncbi:hypothetical protein BKA69DRAFT_819235 [Paraphysoderma sedebokerense]|nr:hypothetical protein BKA69DRAFT_819235 [Paraphysoderma sedebokerense]